MRIFAKKKSKKWSHCNFKFLKIDPPYCTIQNWAVVWNDFKTKAGYHVWENPYKTGCVVGIFSINLKMGQLVGGHPQEVWIVTIVGHR